MFAALHVFKQLLNVERQAALIAFEDSKVSRQASAYVKRESFAVNLQRLQLLVSTLQSVASHADNAVSAVAKHPSLHVLNVS